MSKIDLDEFKTSCKAQLRNDMSKNILRPNGLPIQETVVGVSTLEYLHKFREKTGFIGSDHSLENDTLQTLQNECGEIMAKMPGDPTLLDAMKGLNDLKRMGEDQGFKLTGARLSGRQMEDPSLLSEFYNLKSIDISNNCVKSVNNLGEMPYLQTINASNNQIETFLEMDPRPIALKEADFSHNKIKKTVPLLKFWSLTDINLSHNELTVIEGFSHLEFLQVLNLSHNKIHTIRNLDCPNLIMLYLNCNKLTSMSEYLGCPNLRYINLKKNKISKIKGLKYLTALTEVLISDNNIEDISELENLKPLLTLTRIKLERNPITTLEFWRLILIHILPQILWVDGRRLEATELRAAENIFNPSFKKIAFTDHTAILLDRACQSANSIFDDHCRIRPFPPVLLLVGPPKSQRLKLALLLKQKFRNKVYLGGVHSTATTIEGSNTVLDIPVSYESYKDMRNRGEFLATSKILGRVCGFATSQIARAAEKGAILVAAVPLTTAISLCAWKLKPKLVLVLPSNPPEFPIEEERIETLKRSSLKRSSEKEEDLGTQAAQVAAHYQPGPCVPPPDADHHNVNFADMLSVAPSQQKYIDNVTTQEVQDKDFSETRQHSILKKHPHFEFETVETVDQKGQLFELKEDDSKTKLTPKFIGELNPQAEAEAKRKRLKSLGPGMERYKSLADLDLDDDEINEFIDEYAADGENEDDENGLDDEIEPIDDEYDEDEFFDTNYLDGDNGGLGESGEGKFENEEEQAFTETIAKGKPPVSKLPDQSTTTEGNPAQIISDRPRRLNRLASLLMLRPDQKLDSPLNITDILMNFSTVEKADPKVFQLETYDLPITATADNAPVDNNVTFDVGNNEVATGKILKTVNSQSFSLPRRSLADAIQALETENEMLNENENAMLQKTDEGENNPIAVIEPPNKIRKSETLLDKENIEETNASEPQQKEEEIIIPPEIIAPPKTEKEYKRIYTFTQELPKCTDTGTRPKKPKCARKSKIIENIYIAKNFGENNHNIYEEMELLGVICPPNTAELKEAGEISEAKEDIMPLIVVSSDRDIKRGVFYDGELSTKFALEKSIGVVGPEASPEFLLTGDQNMVYDANVLSNKVDEARLPRVKSNGQVEAELKPLIPVVPNETEDSGKPQSSKRKKKGLRFLADSSEVQEDSSVDLTATDRLGDDVPAAESPEESKVVGGVKKIKKPVKMSESEQLPITTDEHEHEEHHLSHKEALTSSILQTRGEYAEFHNDNPGFFHVVVDTSDMCQSYEIIESIVTDSLIKYKPQESNSKRPLKSHAGMNLLDEKQFLLERMKHFKACASIWSRGYSSDGVNLGGVDRRWDNKAAQPCEIFFEKSTCPPNLLDPTLPRPSITSKMKRIVELHNKKLRISKKM